MSGLSKGCNTNLGFVPSPAPKESYPFTRVIIEGELEDVTDRSQYGLEPLPEGVKLGFYTIKSILDDAG